ncbi:cytidine deaminase [candidate division WOR-3 bacterium]|jgi:cytidine deaminase|nr:cytidine deaminase [candidate division WOR-3 bacterium]
MYLLKEKSDYKIIYDKLKSLLKNSYAPFSKFNVASAAEGGSGNIYYGVNVENVSFSLTICAERNAIFHAISKGEKTITKVFILSTAKSPITPCGACRQVISEFSNDAKIIMFSNDGVNYEEKSIKKLLPDGFDYKV